MLEFESLKNLLTSLYSLTDLVDGEADLAENIQYREMMELLSTDRNTLLKGVIHSNLPKTPFCLMVIEGQKVTHLRTEGTNWPTVFREAADQMDPPNRETRRKRKR